MKKSLLGRLACPGCGGSPLDLSVTRTTQITAWNAHAPAAVLTGVDEAHRKVTDILDGSLGCPACGAEYPISNGIPRLLVHPDRLPPRSARAWTTFDGPQKVWEDTFLDLIAPVEPAGLLGKLVLDAGAGFGRHTLFAARYGAEVIAMDLSPEAVDATRRNTAHMFNVHVVQADIHNPPFRSGNFDMVFCLGVLHHVDRPREAFRRLGSLLSTGGRMSVWVYGPRQGAASLVSRGLRALTTRMEPDDLHLLSRGLAAGLRVFSHAPYKALEPLPGVRSLVTRLPVHDHHQWPFPVVVADVYDRLRIPVTLTPTGETLERWFEEDSYSSILVTRRVRNNESFRGTGLRR